MRVEEVAGQVGMKYHKLVNSGFSLKHHRGAWRPFFLCPLSFRPPLFLHTHMHSTPCFNQLIILLLVLLAHLQWLLLCSLFSLSWPRRTEPSIGESEVVLVDKDSNDLSQQQLLSGVVSDTTLPAGSLSASLPCTLVTSS